MKKVTYILSILVLSMVFGTASSQTFTSKDTKVISQKVDSLLNLYTLYSSFSKDAVSLNEEYISGCPCEFRTCERWKQVDIDIHRFAVGKFSLFKEFIT